MISADAIMITQAVDEEDPVLGFTQGWINALAENLRRLSVFCLRAGKHELRENVSLHVLGKGRTRRLWRLRKGLKADVRDMNVRAIIAHMCPRYAVAARKLVGRNVPILLWYAQWAESRWLHLAHDVCRFVLTPTAESCPVQSEKVIAVGHGIDTEKFKPSLTKQRDSIVLLSAGRISAEKRYDFLIAAVAEAAGLLSRGKLSLRILGSPCVPGDARHLSELKELVRDRGLERVVEFRPAVSYTRIQDEYANCDVFVNTTIRHSLDKAPLEAMACGKTVLTSNDSFRAVLGEHSDSLVADDKNPGDLAKKIANVARMKPTERETLGLSLRDIIVRDHNLKRLMKRVAGIIDSP